MQLVFPIVLTPYGLGALIGLLTLSQDPGRTMLVVGVLVVVLLLDLLATAFARPILRAVGPVLQVLGAFLGSPPGGPGAPDHADGAARPRRRGSRDMTACLGNAP